MKGRQGRYHDRLLCKRHNILGNEKTVDKAVTMTSVTLGVSKTGGKKESKMNTENKKFKEKEN